MHIMEKINAHPLMLFTKSTCGFCQSAKTLLDKLQVQYEIEELDKRDDCDALQDMLQKLTGARSVSTCRFSPRSLKTIFAMFIPLFAAVPENIPA